MASISQLFAIFALFAWVPVILVFFVLLPARRAVVAGVIAAWLLLPPIGIDLPGIPDYNKAAAATIGIALATLIFEAQRLAAFRLRWFDLPMLLWCACPLISSNVNGLGAYDGASMCVRQCISWLFPYLVGRLYLTDLKGIRELALGMVIGGACLVPLCLFEMRMSPILAKLVYGIDKFEGTRFGGYRPRIFFGAGLELGLWMNIVTLVAWWLWRTGEFKRWAGFRSGIIVGALLLTTIACRSTGAFILFLAGVAALWTAWQTKSKWPIWALLLVPPVYCSVRTANLWSGTQAVQLVRLIASEERTYSFEFRLLNEDLLIAKALQQPFFGWGGWGRNLVYDDSGRVLSNIDQLWMVALGSYGIVGLTLFTTALLLPAVLFLNRFSVQQWAEPGLASAAVIAVVVDVSLLDGLLNGMINLVYIVAAGGLVNIATSRTLVQALPTSPGMAALEKQSLAYQSAGRALRDQGRYLEARNAWSCALDLLSKQLSARPDLPVLRQRWCECANDLAWLLAMAADPVVRDPATALSLASQASTAYPECGAYWNTLGAASYRMQDFRAALTALDRAIWLNGGGTAFDLFFLAMAHAQLGDQQQARTESCVGRGLDGATLPQPRRIALSLSRGRIHGPSRLWSTRCGLPKWRAITYQARARRGCARQRRRLFVRVGCQPAARYCLLTPHAARCGPSGKTLATLILHLIPKINTPRSTPYNG